MGDRVWVTIEIGGRIMKHVFDDILKAIHEEGGYAQDLDYNCIDIENGIKIDPNELEEFIIEECKYGNIDSIQDIFDIHKIPYRTTWEAGGDFDAGTTMNLYDEFGEQSAVSRQDPAVSFAHIRHCASDPSKLVQLIQLADWWDQDLPEIEIIG